MVFGVNSFYSASSFFTIFQSDRLLLPAIAALCSTVALFWIKPKTINSKILVVIGTSLAVCVISIIASKVQSIVMGYYLKKVFTCLSPLSEHEKKELAEVLDSILKKEKHST